MKHTHTFVKHETRKGYYRCNDPHCTSFFERSFIVGKASKCLDCGSEFILSREDLKRARPKCLKCSNTKEAKTFRAAAALFQKVQEEKIVIGYEKEKQMEQAQEEKGFELD